MSKFCQILPSLILVMFLADAKNTGPSWADRLANDILRSPNAPSGAQKAVPLSNLWSGAKIPYTIANGFDEKQKANIAKAFGEYHQLTCIRFTPRKSENDYITIENSGGCSSYVGRVGGGQRVSLGGSCANNVGVVLHELMHAVGFHHHQSRPDRDNYIYVDDSNLIKETAWLYGKHKEELLLDVPYDTQSLMHYHDAFQIDPKKPVMYSFDGSKIGTRDVFTKSDLLNLNRLYNCDKNDCWNSSNCNGGSGPLVWQNGNFGQFVFAARCDFAGSDLTQLHAVSHEICRRFCLQNVNCTHITWNVATKTCYMKKSPSAYPLSIRAVVSKQSVCGYVNHRSAP